MASSASSGLSSQASNSMSDREPTPEHPPMAAYNTLAPQWWDERDWDFAAWSEDDASLTNGEEDLQFLADGELEADSTDDALSWDGVDSSDEEEEEDTSSEEYQPVKYFRSGSSEDTEDDYEDEEAPAGIWISSSED